MELIALEKGATVTSDWYVDNCIKMVLQKLQENRPKTKDKNIVLHYDNAPGQKASKHSGVFKDQKSN